MCSMSINEDILPSLFSDHDFDFILLLDTDLLLVPGDSY